ncbi:MAG: NAD(P)/FAD-dependent oxidoreductase [Pirellulales bacterium]|nr:NAD(P)/FAD-dependent oxidoreductase [Pirellulales bacterium]
MSVARPSVVVVGASLSGLMAARALRDHGIDDFLVIDRKRWIGVPLKCGEAVEASAFDELFGQGARYPFIKHVADTHDVVFRDFVRPLLDVPQLTFYELNRTEFERWLAEPVSDALRLSLTVRSIARCNFGFELETNQGLIQSRAVILCCGSNYELQRQLGLVSSLPRLGYACGELHATSDRHRERFVWHVMDRCEGYGWVFPKGNDGCNLGILSYRPEPLRSRLAEFKQLQAIATTPRTTFGGRFPQDGPLACTAADSLLVCGDAAGMVFAATGEGIRFALISGNLAGTVMAEAMLAGDTSRRQLSRYQDAWERRFGRVLRVGVRVKEVIMSLRRSGFLTSALRHLADRRIADFMLGKHARLTTLSYSVARCLELPRKLL